MATFVRRARGVRNTGVRRGCDLLSLSRPRCSARYTGGMETPEKRRWYRPTPGWLVLGSLAVTGVLFLSNWFGWPAWHKGYAVLVAVAAVGVVLLLMLAWFVVALVVRWRFQFRIRTLLVLVVAAALPFSWLAVELKQARCQNQAAAAVRTGGGWVSYGWMPEDPDNPFATGPVSLEERRTGAARRIART